MKKALQRIVAVGLAVAVGGLVALAADHDKSGGGTVGVPAYSGKPFTLKGEVTFTAAAPGVLNDTWTLVNIPAKSLVKGVYVWTTNSIGTGTVTHAWTFSLGDRNDTSNLLTAATAASYGLGQVASNITAGYRFYPETNAIIVLAPTGIVPSNTTFKVRVVGENFAD